MGCGILLDVGCIDFDLFELMFDCDMFIMQLNEFIGCNMLVCIDLIMLEELVVQFEFVCIIGVVLLVGVLVICIIYIDGIDC